MNSSGLECEAYLVHFKGIVPHLVGLSRILAITIYMLRYSD